MNVWGLIKGKIASIRRTFDTKYNCTSPLVLFFEVHFFLFNESDTNEYEFFDSPVLISLLTQLFLFSFFLLSQIKELRLKIQYTWINNEVSTVFQYVRCT